MGYCVFAVVVTRSVFEQVTYTKHIYNTWFDYVISILLHQVLFLILQFKGLKTRCLTAGKPDSTIRNVTNVITQTEL